MSAELEGVADIAAGAVLATAVEPPAGNGYDVAYDGDTNCLNCGTALTGNHCHSCGQKANVHRTLRAFGHDFVHSVLHFDGKIWRTLPMLAWKPGELTRRYIHGERAKFVSPLALFLFSVFLTFAVFSMLSPAQIDFQTKNKATSAASQIAVLEKERAKVIGDIAELKADKAEAIAENLPSAWMDAEILRHQKLLKDIDEEKAPELQKRVAAERQFQSQRRENENAVNRLEDELARAKVARQPTAKIEEELEGARLAVSLMTTANDLVTKGKSDADINIMGIESLNQAAKHATENPQLLFYKIQSNTYKYSWALIPISLPFLWLLFFWHRKFKLFDHAVFITYSLCFMMTFAMLCAVILQFTAEGSFLFVIAVLALIFVPPLHMYRQLRHAYGLTRFGAVWRAVLLAQFAILALGLFAALIFALGVAA